MRPTLPNISGPNQNGYQVLARVETPTESSTMLLFCTLIHAIDAIYPSLQVVCRDVYV